MIYVRLKNFSICLLHCNKQRGQFYLLGRQTHLWTGNKKVEWNKVISDAEKIVGYPTSYLSLRCLLSDEISNVALHLRKLVGTKHPLLQTAKGLIYDGKNNLQTRGLVVLLLSKAAKPLSSHEQIPYEQDVCNIYNSQRTLAELTEMIHTANLIHKGVVNLSELLKSEGSSKDMEFGNKMAVLSGDFLLANVCTELAQFRNTKVLRMIAEAIGNLMEAEFVGLHDNKGNHIPFKDISLEDWSKKTYLSCGSLLANSCCAALELANHDENVKEQGFLFGKYMAFVRQLYLELQPFINKSSKSFDLTSAPVILYMQRNPSILQEILHYQDNVEDINYNKLAKKIATETTIKESMDLCKKYGNEAQDVLANFPNTDAKSALENMIHALTNFKIYEEN